MNQICPQNPIDLSVVVPVFNERDNLAALVKEIVSALRGHVAFEVIYVDDHSADDSPQVLAALRSEFPELRILRHDRQSGQSTAIRTGAKAARGAWIATLDGDGQNDPADINRLLLARDAASSQIKLFAGWRVQRQDNASKRWASRWANRIRKRLLKDDADDTGCGLKAFRRDAFLALPYFNHMHRYLPALFSRDGWQVRHIDVTHAPRLTGRSNYGNLNRAIVGIFDLAGVAWLIRRRKTARAVLLTPAPAASRASAPAPALTDPALAPEGTINA